MRDHINLLHSLKEKGTPVVMPMRNENSKISVLSYEGVAISASSKNKKNAWEFIKLLMRADLDTQKRTFGMPINKKALESLYSKGLYDYYEEYATFQEEIDSVYFHSTVDNNLSNIFRKYGRDEADFESTIKSINELLEIYVSE